MFPLNEIRASFFDWLRGSADDQVLRWLYRILLAATVTVGALDYAELQEDAVTRSTAAPATDQPAAWPLPARQQPGSQPLWPLQRHRVQLSGHMTFDLVGDGKLMASGTIMPGTAKAFAEEVAKRGSYIKTVVLQSPGGSVRDALAIGRLIRDRKLSTEVDSGRYCASACPLVFAGGVERRAEANATIGVHEVAALDDAGVSPADALKNGQQISAECEQYLLDMGIDPEVWIHAMETPNDQLYYFRPEELRTFKLATVTGYSKPHTAKRT